MIGSYRIITLGLIITFACTACGGYGGEYMDGIYTYEYRHFIKPMDTSIYISELKYENSEKFIQTHTNGVLPLAVSAYKETVCYIQTNVGSFKVKLLPKIEYEQNDEQINILYYGYNVGDNNFNKLVLPNPIRVQSSSPLDYYKRIMVDTLFFK
jgi:hypothetical protein